MSPLEWLLEPLQFEFMVRGLLASVTVGVLCSVVGAFVVVRGMAFIGDAMAHSIFPGVVIAYLLGASFLLGALAAGVFAALLIGFVSKRTALNEQTSIGIVFAGSFALGIVLLSSVNSYAVDLARFLFGNVLGVGSGDLALTLGVAALVLLAVVVLYRPLVFVSFDPVGARAIGLPVERLEYALLGLLALSIVVALQTVGNVLVLSMLVTPAATAWLFTKRLPALMGLGAVLGAVASAVGLYVSYYASLAPGATIVLTSCVMFGVAALLRGRVLRGQEVRRGRSLEAPARSSPAELGLGGPRPGGS